MAATVAGGQAAVKGVGEALVPEFSPLQRGDDLGHRASVPPAARWAGEEVGRAVDERQGALITKDGPSSARGETTRAVIGATRGA